MNGKGFGVGELGGKGSQGKPISSKAFQLEV